MTNFAFDFKIMLTNLGIMQKNIKFSLKAKSNLMLKYFTSNRYKQIPGNVMYI